MDLLKKFYTEFKKNGTKIALKKTKKYLIKENSLPYLKDSNSFGAINFNPLVSLIAVNYNGQNDLPIFLESIFNQSYQNFELIIIDNNSSDNSKEIIENYQKLHKNITYINSGTNLGFAAGNNYAISYCKGELYSLINIDTKVHEDWLKELVDAMSQDGDCVAVCSKTLFFERFQNVEITAKNSFNININSLINSLEYKKYFLRQGRIENDFLYSEKNKIIISLPIQESSIKISFLDLIDEIVSIKIGKKTPEYFTNSKNNFFINLTFNQKNIINSSYIINNAGSISINNMPADRGIGEYDSGQYDSKCYVDFFCGVSVLLRRSFLVDRKIFVSEFFAYYEDSELSRYIRNQGYKILYAPKSIVYHKHSSTSSEGSPLWQLLVSRSQYIYNYKGSDYYELYHQINHIEESFKTDIKLELYDILKTFSSKLVDRLQVENNIVEKLKPIGIYNSYWNTKGGGESHALSFAKVLQQYEIVYLISEEDFSIKELSEYYNMNLSNCRKIVQENITTEFTRKFDIFINSTYCSNLISNATNSFYIVFFPQKNIKKEVLESYTFLYMNEYTKNWAVKYWGKDHKMDIVHPLGMLSENKNISILAKEKIVISVGRFFINAHSKKQDIIALAFKELNEEYKEKLKDWKLVLLGSLNFTNSDDVSYVGKIHNILKDVNYELITNVDREILNQYYSKSFVYIHASGFGTNHEIEPENIEHFGITPIEAMRYNCYPIVYKYGGPRETLDNIKVGMFFENLEELKNNILEVINKFDSNYDNEVSLSIENYIHNNFPDKKIEEIYKKTNKE